jgi:hypothetical protein
MFGALGQNCFELTSRGHIRSSGYIILKTPAASTAGPFLSSLPVSVNGLGGVWLEALGAILGYLGEKLGYLGRAWRQVGTLLAACWEKDDENGP